MNDLSEKEQLDMMRTWWSENGRYVVGGIALGIAILFGWNHWRDSTASADIEASEMYEVVMTNVGNNNTDAAIAASTTLFEAHPDSIYAAQGKLAMARLYMDVGRDQDAADVLQDLVDNDGDSEVGLVGRLRLAKVLLYQNKADDVVALLESELDNAFAPRFNEVLGDAYVALGEFAKAEAAYGAAMADAQGSRAIDTNLIQLKINDLPAADSEDAADTAASTATGSESPQASAGIDGDAEPPPPEEVSGGDEAPQ